MPKALQNNLLVIFFLIPLIFFSCMSETAEKTLITIMTYNAGNLFDDVDNGSEYSEYDPGKGNWTTEDFNKKLENIAEVIKNSSDIYTNGGPDIVALQEIENEHVLNVLCDNYLSGYDYRVMYPVEGSAANCAIISRIKIEEVNVLLPADTNSNTILRAILQIEINVNGNSLYIFNNHWKSKLGGAEETEAKRLLSSEMLAGRINEILTYDPDADIIVLGDFNENVKEYSETGSVYQTALMPVSALGESNIGKSLFLAGAVPSTEIEMAEQAIILYEPWYEISTDDYGSYNYGGKWQTPDHILLSSGLFDKEGFYYLEGDFSIVSKDFLIDPETGYPLKEGYASYVYSDHLPLIVNVSFGKAN